MDVPVRFRSRVLIQINMKKIIIACFLASLCLSCSTTEQICAIYDGHQLYKGPKGGCYYINGNGGKTYIEREKCHCNY